MHWANDYVGTPWVSGGQGPDGYDCWSLVRHVNKKHFSRTLPLFIVDADNLRACLRQFRDAVDRGPWQQTDTPGQGDVVLMGSGQYADHCGVYMGDRTVMHCERGCGVVVSSCKSLPWNWVRYYRWAG